MLEGILEGFRSSNGGPDLPERLRSLIAAREERSERLVGWVQLAITVVLMGFYALTPTPTDSTVGMIGFQPVPTFLSIYAVLTLARLYMSYRGPLPGWLLLSSIIVDISLLLFLLWFTQYQYAQTPAFTLKLPGFIYLFVFIAMRTLRFDPRFVLATGGVAIVGWIVLVAVVVLKSGPGTITHEFNEYVRGNKILIGVEIERIVMLAIVTGVLALAVAQSRRLLITAITEETSSRDLKRFVSMGVADVINQAESAPRAGEASERNAAVLMLDLRNFTKVSAQLKPREIVEILTQMHARVVPVVERHGGAIDKFLGDGVMATFGAVNPSETAARDALLALREIMAEAPAWENEVRDARPGLKKLKLNGAAVAGPLVFATLGNAERLEYTVIGEVANLAAKIEKHNKVEGTRALTTIGTLKAASRQGLDIGELREKLLRDRQIAGVSDPLDLIVLAGA